tara:strand:+ start:8240 stop:10669 length:2430 start_codon:yes stop_codon:yes gene_type:complete
MEKVMNFNFIISLLMLSSVVLTQVSINSTPKSFSLDEETVVLTKTLPAFNVQDFLREDENEMRLMDVKPYRFANPIPVDFNMENSGTWIILEDGTSIWRLRIESKDAFSINIIYDIFNIPKGAEFFVYSENQEMILGAFTDDNHKPHGGFSTAPVVGDKIILEYNEPHDAEFRGDISISTVAHDYRNVFFNEDRGYGDSGSCNNNVACSVGDDWQDEVRSVAMILTSGGSRLCTGSIINNGAQDLTPYFLTANHCLGGNNSWIFMFNYESPVCTNQNGPTNMTVSGSTLLENSSTSDFALLLLNETPPESYNVHYAGWDVSGSTPNIPVGIHHPSGDIKKISFDYDNASNSGSYWDVDSWDDGTTEPGSSGSPLFDGLTHRIIGQLYGGVASCTNFGYDTYGKTSVSWGLGLNNYLDPYNVGLTYLDGIDAIDLPDPALSYSDFDLIFDLEEGDSDISSFEISNTGEPESVLSYSINISQFESPMGGPDIAENYWTDSDNESALESDWIDITSIGTQYNFYDNDEASEAIDIGFSFPFYGENYNECIINPNGWIGFGNDNDAWDNVSIPSTSAPRPAIFGFWDDLNPVNDNCSSCEGEVYYHTDGSRLVVWFNNVAHWPSYFDNSIYNFQIVIYSTGEIQYNYDSMTGDFSSATIGMQNAQGNSGLQMSFNTSYAHNNLTTYIAKAPSWVGINEIGNFELTGELEQGFSDIVNVMAQNDGLAEGVYNAYLNISSNASNSESFLIEMISSNNNLVGDVNGDDIINVLDVIQLVNMALGNQEPDYSTGDVNQDGEINILDVVQVVNIILEG